MRQINVPLYDQDIWTPVSDYPNCWVSVGNADPLVRLDKAHDSLFGFPAWGETSDMYAFRSKMVVKAPSLIGLPTHGTVPWSQAASFAKANNCTLPTKAQVILYLRRCGDVPLFNSDVWTPIADEENSWISVGNCDPTVRLGKTHKQLFGEPGWGQSTDAFPFRQIMLVIPKTSKPAKLANPLMGIPTLGNISWTVANSTRNLPTIAQVNAFISSRGGPLFDFDVWTPCCDYPNCWVSVGNADPAVRLGKTHDANFGPPAWGETETTYDFRKRMLIIAPTFGSLTSISTPGDVSWSNSARYANNAGGTLPSVAQVTEYLQAHGNAPLFQQDVWTPCCDYPNCYVSVGNVDPPVRFGKTHDANFGIPAWGETTTAYDFRKRMLILPIYN